MTIALGPHASDSLGQRKWGQLLNRSALLTEETAHEMTAARDLMAYVVLLAALMAAIPALVGLSAEVVSLAIVGYNQGFFASETRQAASQFVSTSQGAAIWLGLLAIMIGNFLLTRIWACVAGL